MNLYPNTRNGALWRFALAAVIVIAFTATTTAVAGLLQVRQFLHEITVNPALQANIDIPPPGAPQTILLIGSDHRAVDPYTAAHTDTMLLIRLDAQSQTINMLSIPRDLQVRLPNGTTGRINDAYSVGGGPNGVIGVLKSQVFPSFHVNHVIDVNFRGFSDMIDAIGCVDTDVDHRYYNDTALTNYSSINIQPGYQKLCGDHQSSRGALAFVRFRHTDSDLVRNARQQDFLRWAKVQYGVGNLVANRVKLVRIFGKNAQTDRNFQSSDALINLFALLLNLNGGQIKQIKFPADPQPCGAPAPNPVTGIAAQATCFVTASAAAEAAVYREFMSPTVDAPPAKTQQPAPAAGRHGAGSANPGTAGLVADPTGLAQVRALRRVPMPIYYPAMIAPGSQYCSSAAGNCDDPSEPASRYSASYPRGYTLRDQSNVPHATYRMTLVGNPALGEYYGIQGMTWQNPPILRGHPTQTEVVGGKKLVEYFNGHKISLVAWHTPQGVYWVSNTLADSIGNRQLVAIAASLKLARP